MNKIKKQLLERSGGLCENCGKPGQDDAHICAKKMGGRKGIFKKIYDDIRNRVISCRSCHDLIDLKRKQLFPGERDQALEKFKRAAGHAGWLEDFKEYL